MKQLNFPKKYTALAQVWISILLIILAAAMAFTPLLTLNLKGSSFTTAIDDLMDDLREDVDDEDAFEDFEIPDEMNVGTLDVVNAGIVLGKFLSATVDLAASADDEESLREATEKLQDIINSEEGQQALLLGLALASQAMDLDDLMGGDDYIFDDERPDASYSENDYTDERFSAAIGLLYDDGIVTESMARNYVSRMLSCYSDYREDFVRDFDIPEDMAFRDIPDDILFSDMETIINDYLVKNNVTLSSGAQATVDNLDQLKFQLGEYAFADVFAGSQGGDEDRQSFYDFFWSSDGIEKRHNKYVEAHRFQNNFTDMRLGDIIGILYTDEIIDRETVSDYLDGQFQVYSDYQELYLMNHGIEDMKTTFLDIELEMVFRDFREAVDAFLVDRRIRNSVGEQVTYDTLEDFKTDLIEEYGEEEGLQQFKERLNRDNDLKYAITSSEYDIEEFYRHLNSQITSYEGGKLAWYLLEKEYLTWDEFISCFDADNNYNLSEQALGKVLDEEDLEKFIEDEGYKTIVGLTDEDIDRAEKNADTVGSIVKMVLSFIILIYVVGFVTIWPFIMAIVALIALIKALIYIKRPEEYAGKAASKMTTPLTFTVTTFLLLTFFPGVTVSTNLVILLVLAILSVVANLVISRLRAYNGPDFKYATLVQGTALVEGIGFAAFFGGLLNTGFLQSMLDALCSYISKTSVTVSLFNREIDFYNRYFGSNMDHTSMNFLFLIDLALVLAAALIALSVTTKVIRNVATHLGLVKSKTKPGSLATPIWALIACILPLAASFLQNELRYSMTTNGVKTRVIGSLLNISNDSMTALIFMFIGAFILLAAAIAFRVIKPKLCYDLTPDQEEEILNGNAPAYTGEPISAKAPAEEAPAEEAPAEEESVEETPAEKSYDVEASEEEASTEETSAEEAPAEETDSDDKTEA